MNFQFAKSGGSFKGAMAYYTHDKRTPDQDRNPTTSERVAWTETRNMLTDRADTATRIMIATSERAPELKAAAGIKNTGRKATQPVAAFSLAWHPDEAKTLDRTEMTRAADEALKVLRLEHCQAVLIAHRDTAHPHVHVVINRVNPENGRMEKIDPNRVRDLDRWADDYERGRGRIYSQKRAEKYDRMDRKRERHPDREDRKRHIEDRRKRSDAPSERVRARAGGGGRGNESQSPSKALRARSDALKLQHKAEWRDLGREFSRSKSAIYDRWRGPLKEEHARARAESKSVWRDHFGDERHQEQTRRNMERGLVGRLALSIAAAREQMRTPGANQEQSFAGHVVANFFSKDRREQTFAAIALRDRERLSGYLKEIGDERVAPMKEKRAKDLEEARQKYAADREVLSARQNVERAEIRHEWKQLYRHLKLDWTPQRERDREPVQDRSSPRNADHVQGQVHRPDESRETDKEHHRASPFAWLDEKKVNRDTRDPLEWIEKAPQEKTADHDRDPSAFDWLDRQALANDERSAFDKSRDTAEKARDKDQDRDR